MNERQTLRSLLAATALETRVFEPQGAKPSTAYPFAILKAGPEDRGEMWADSEIPFEVWPYVKAVSDAGGDTPRVVLDDLVLATVSALDAKAFTADGIPCISWYDGGAGDDLVDEQWDNALTRPQRFVVARLAYLLDPDPIVVALRDATHSAFPSLQTDPLTWEPTDTAPAVYWRLSTKPVAGEWQTFDARWYAGVADAHVIAPSPGKRWEVASALADAFGRLDEVYRGSTESVVRLTGQRVFADSDPRRQGQFQMDVQVLVDESEEIAPINTATLVLPSGVDPIDEAALRLVVGQS